jgi:hypothetical protein
LQCNFNLMILDVTFVLVHWIFITWLQVWK